MALKRNYNGQNPCRFSITGSEVQVPQLNFNNYNPIFCLENIYANNQTALRILRPRNTLKSYRYLNTHDA